MQTLLCYTQQFIFIQCIHAKPDSAKSVLFALYSVIRTIYEFNKPLTFSRISRYFRCRNIRISALLPLKVKKKKLQGKRKGYF